VNHDAFLADILAHPDDDTPRLVYADWLDDNGDPDRAEFIRVSIERHRLAEDAARHQLLDARIVELLARHEARWTLPLVERGAEMFGWRRGFVERIDSEIGPFLNAQAELFRLTPIRHVAILGPRLERHQVQALIDSPHLGGLERLVVPADTSETAMQRLRQRFGDCGRVRGVTPPE